MPKLVKVTDRQWLEYIIWGPGAQLPDLMHESDEGPHQNPSRSPIELQCSSFGRCRRNIMGVKMTPLGVYVNQKTLVFPEFNRHILINHMIDWAMWMNNKKNKADRLPLRQAQWPRRLCSCARIRPSVLCGRVVYCRNFRKRRSAWFRWVDRASGDIGRCRGRDNQPRLVPGLHAWNPL